MMPVYYVDFQDGRDLYRDNHGIQCETLEQICNMAVSSLKEIADNNRPSNSFHNVIVTVRDRKDNIVYKATLIIDNETRTRPVEVTKSFQNQPSALMFQLPINAS